MTIYSKPYRYFHYFVDYLPMEPNHSVPERFDDTVTSTTTTTIEEQQQLNSTQTRVTGKSYECNFCKRGFTNAQALGGHMNIHRKQKAMLKEPSTSPPPNVGNPLSNSQQGKNRPLPLFGDGSSDSRNIHHKNVTKDPSSPGQELDLELRLGHVESPRDKDNKTRNFF